MKPDKLPVCSSRYFSELIGRLRRHPMGLAFRIAWRNRRTMSAISRSSSDFSSRLALLDSMRFAERCAAVSQVASVMAHLIGTPLQVIAGRAALIRFNPQAETVAENAQKIEEQVERLAQRVRELMEYLTTPEPDIEPRQLDTLVAEALSLYEPIAARTGLQIASIDACPEAMVEGSPTLVVLTSLLSLAIRTANGGERIELKIKAHGGDKIGFELKFPGLALPKARIGRFDPPDSDGGNAEQLQVLSVCNAIARQHGGKLELVSPTQGQTAIQFECHILR